MRSYALKIIQPAECWRLEILKKYFVILVALKTTSKSGKIKRCTLMQNRKVMKQILV